MDKVTVKCVSYIGDHKCSALCSSRYRTPETAGCCCVYCSNIIKCVELTGDERNVCTRLSQKVALANYLLAAGAIEVEHEEI